MVGGQIHELASDGPLDLVGALGRLLLAFLLEAEASRGDCCSVATGTLRSAVTPSTTRCGGRRSTQRAWRRTGSCSTACGTGAHRACSPREHRSPLSPDTLGDTVETVSRTYVHWLRDDRDVPAQVLDRLLAKRDLNVEAAGF